MARKNRRRMVDFAVYLTVRMLVCLIQAMPMRVALGAAEWLGWLTYRIDRRHREVAAENLRYAFPELAGNPVRTDRLVRATYRHFALVAIEMVLLPRKLHLVAWRRYATMYPAVKMCATIFSPRPAILLSGHFGNWELAGRLIGVFGLRTYAIARVLDNPYLDRFLKHFRQGTGQTLIAKKDDFDRLQEVLRGGAKVGVLADQDAGRRGVFVDFFGRPASTHKALALMSLEFDAPLVVLGIPRLSEPMFYSVVCEDVIDPREYEGRADAVRAITERYSAALERLIRRHPEQYFWLHRRWKSQPATKGTKPAERKAA